VGISQLLKGTPRAVPDSEHGCGKRWRSDIVASYGRDTDVDEVEQSMELIMMGRGMKKAQCAMLLCSR
jgi:hypothetical protein